MKILLLPINAGITGFESPAAEYAEMGLSLDELLIEHPSASYFARAQGHSMEGVGIFSGDLLIISRGTKAITGDVIVANLNGEFVCKTWDPANRQLHSAGSGAKPYQLNADDQFQVEGVVIHSVRMHRPMPRH